MYNNFYSELYHYGTELYHWRPKGSKNGVRRWTNPDGTLNEAGKARYAKMYGSQNSQAETRRSQYINQKAASAQRKFDANRRAASTSSSMSSQARLRKQIPMNSQAAIASSRPSTSFITNSPSARKRMQLASMNSQAATASAKDRKRIHWETMNKQASTASAKDRKRINRENQMKSMASQGKTRYEQSDAYRAKKQKDSMGSQASTAYKSATRQGKAKTNAAISDRVNAKRIARGESMNNQLRSMNKQAAARKPDLNVKEDIRITNQRAKNAERDKILKNKKDQKRAMEQERIRNQRSRELNEKLKDAYDYQDRTLRSAYDVANYRNSKRKKR